MTGMCCCARATDEAAASTARAADQTEESLGNMLTNGRMAAMTRANSKK